MAIVILAVAECALWLVAGLVQWTFAGFSLGPVYSAQVAEGARASLTELAWGALNVVGLIAYLLRGRGWGRWLMAAIQVANLAVTIYLAFDTVRYSCGQDGWGVFWFAAIPAGSLLLQCLIWRRIDRRPRSSTPLAALRTPATLAIVVTLVAVGAILLGYGWGLGLYAIESHAGTVSSATKDPGGLSITLDSSSRVYTFLPGLFDPQPSLNPGEHVVILTGEACDYGTPLAIQSTHGLWVEQFSGDAVRPYAPFTWQEHERLRWLLLAVGMVIEVIALAGFALWIG